MTPKLAVQMGHHGNILSMAFTPDGRYVLTGSNDRTAVLWDLALGLEIRRFEGNIFAVEAVDISPDGNFVAISSEKEVILSDLLTGRVIIRLPASKVVSLDFSPDSKQLVVARLTDQGDFVEVWNIQTEKTVREFMTPSLAAVKFSPTGQQIAVASGDVTIWNMTTESPIQRIVTPNDSIQEAV
ncbi:MAG: WD40 repeat domain-containing protein, partial [Candidatus Hodarchaeota archaeon]